MSIGIVGIGHQCPIHIRERVSFTKVQKAELIELFKAKQIEEVVILSTCNRSEIYIWDENLEEKLEVVKAVYTKLLGLEVREYLFCKVSEEALFHLYEVASGLDSLVLGEDQILGQVKDALEVSMEHKASGKMLNKIFREAITEAKWIKSTLKISEHPTSISYVAAKFLKEQLGTLEGKRILVIGAGKMGKLVMTYLEEEKVEKIYLSNRTHGKAEELDARFEKIEAVEYEERYHLLTEVDAVVCATASHHVILKREEMPNMQRPLCMIDIALPRDIDPAIGKMQGISLYDIDSLKAICEQNNETRKRLANKAKEMMKEKVQELTMWIECTDSDKVIEKLEQKRYEIEKNTLEYIKRKTDLQGHDQKIVEKMVAASLKNFVRVPAVNLKGVKDKAKREAYITMLEELFDL